MQYRKTTTKATEGTAEADSRPTNMQPKPDVSTASTECTENSDRAIADHRAMADTALTEGMDITNTNTGMAQGIVKTDTTPTLTLIFAPTQDFFKQTSVSSQQQVSSLRPELGGLPGSCGPSSHSHWATSAFKTSTAWWDGKQFLEEAREFAPLDRAPSLPHASSRCQPW